MYCLKPFDEETLLQVVSSVKAVITIEEHGPFGGLGAMASQTIGKRHPKPVWNLSLPDAPVISGTSREVFDYYGLNAEGIAARAREMLSRGEKEA